MTTVEMAAPARTVEQRRAALKKGNYHRIYRAGVKRDLKAGRRKVLPLLLDPPAELGSMKLVDLLLAQPKVGRVRADRLLRLCQVSPSKTLGGLSERQRRELAGRLSG